MLKPFSSEQLLDELEATAGENIKDFDMDSVIAEVITHIYGKLPEGFGWLLDTALPPVGWVGDLEQTWIDAQPSEAELAAIFQKYDKTIKVKE